MLLQDGPVGAFQAVRVPLHSNSITSRIPDVMERSWSCVKSEERPGGDRRPAAAAAKASAASCSLCRLLSDDATTVLTPVLITVLPSVSNTALV